MVGTVSDLQRQRPSVHTASVVARKLSYLVWLHCEYVLAAGVSPSLVCAFSPVFLQILQNLLLSRMVADCVSFFAFHVQCCVNVLEPK